MPTPSQYFEFKNSKKFFAFFTLINAFSMYNLILFYNTINHKYVGLIIIVLNIIYFSYTILTMILSSDSKIMNIEIKKNHILAETNCYELKTSIINITNILNSIFYITINPTAQTNFKKLWVIALSDSFISGNMQDFKFEIQKFVYSTKRFNKFVHNNRLKK